MTMIPALTLVRHLAHKIHTQYDDPAQRHQVVWWLLEALTGKSKLQLLVDTHEIPEEIKLQLHELLHEHVAHNKPLQYLLKTVPFCNLNIAVRPPVLIPRPETEEWCSSLIAQLHPVRNLPLRILDLCTGSGCIALSLAHALPNSRLLPWILLMKRSRLRKKMPHTIKSQTFHSSNPISLHNSGTKHSI